MELPSNLNSAAPALTRGLAVLATLEDGREVSLEAMAGNLKLPKPSVFRLLGALQELGLVRKNADKRYQALWKLVPFEDLRTLRRQRLEAPMRELCQVTSCTVEWYETSNRGMELIRQEVPETELRVQARPGFIRTWNEELDCVALLGHAFSGKPLVKSTALNSFKKDGLREPISLALAHQKMTKAQREKTACDPAFNHNGVRRVAVPLFQNNQFYGVLALASIYRFRPPLQPKQLLELLKKFTKEI